MSGRRSTARTRALAGGPAVPSDLAPIPSRMSTAYGSPTSVRIRNPRRGQVKDLTSIIEAIKQGSELSDSDDDEGSRPGTSRSSHPRNTPSAPGPTSAPASKQMTLGPQQELDAEDLVMHENDPPPASRRQSQRPSAVVDKTALQPLSSNIPPPRQQNLRPTPSDAPPLASGSVMPIDLVGSQPTRPTNQKRGQAPAAATPITRGTGPRAVSESPIQPPRSHAGPRQGSLPPIHTPMDTSRSFGAESAIFGSAFIPTTPASHPENNALGPPGNIGTIEEEGEDETEEDGVEDEDEPSASPERKKRTRVRQSPPSPSRTSPRFRDVEGRPGRNQSQGREFPPSTSTGYELRNRNRTKNAETTSPQSQKPRGAQGASSTQPFRSTRSRNSRTQAASVGQAPEPSSSPDRGDAKSIFDSIAPKDINEEIALLRERQRLRQEQHTEQQQEGQPQQRDQGDTAQEVTQQNTFFTSLRRRYFRPSETEEDRLERERQEAIDRTQTAIRTLPRSQVRSQVEQLPEVSWSSRMATSASRVVRNPHKAAWSATASLFRQYGAVVFLLLLSAILYGLSFVPGLVATAVQGDDIHWYGWRDISHNLGQFIPTSILHPISALGDEESREIHDFMRKFKNQMEHVKRASKLHDDSLKSLEKILPKVVRMELDKSGRPVISQEFWHALRDVMKADGSVLTFDVEGRTYKFTSDQQWRAIRNRLDNENKANGSLLSNSEVERLVDKAVSTSWESWLARNEQPAKGATGSDDVFVDRKEFLKHVEENFKTHRHEIRQEIHSSLATVYEQVEGAVKEALDRRPAGVTKTELHGLMDAQIRKAIANAGLQGMAKGKIRANWDAELKHQVNFFSRGANAVVDARRTTPTWKPVIEGSFASEQYIRNMLRRSQESHPAIAALLGWADAGDCWCGSVTKDRAGRSAGTTLAVQLSRTIIPQHVVVEHILPGATLDPSARPKEIEVYAFIQEMNLLKRVRDFSAAFFPGSAYDRGGGLAAIAPLNYDGFVKIGQFTYESSDVHDGVHVHRLSDELLNMEAVTDHVLVRAVSNYGAEDHTCFYRVRLYGERRDDE